MWAGRAPSCDGIRFCHGTIPVLEKIASCSRALELSACWLSSSVQLLPQCCLCVDAILVCIAFFSHCWLTSTNLFNIISLSFILSIHSCAQHIFFFSVICSLNVLGMNLHLKILLLSLFFLHLGSTGKRNLSMFVC